MASSATSAPLQPSSVLSKDNDRPGRVVFDPSHLQNKTNIPKEYLWPLSERPDCLEELEAPVVDLKGFLQGDESSTRRAAEMVREACLTHGFFQVINHGINPSLFHDAMTNADQLFHLPLETKLKIERQPGNFWGYTGAHADRLSSKLPWKETLSFGYDDVGSKNGIVNYFVSSLGKDFESIGWVYERYFGAMKELSLKLLELLAISLGVDQEYFREYFKDGESVSRCNYYPPCQVPEAVLGTGPHNDPNGLTLLLQDQVGGLEVFSDGKWRAVKPEPDALVINVGDTFMGLTNGIYKSCLHRAVVNSEITRQSIVFFLCPRGDRVLRPPEALVSQENPRKYPDFTWSELLSFTQNSYRVDGETLQYFSQWLLSSKATE
ncbi:gibberellin 20 oxidase 2 [Elaeis guineensis]|uniref:gibberellin 20 oxidase 2 n=1 Tax=Elaeis guineensis var. tenera TaxID=51953 RepID=UPI003C6D5ACE